MPTVQRAMQKKFRETSCGKPMHAPSSGQSASAWHELVQKLPLASVPSLRVISTVVHAPIAHDVLPSQCAYGGALAQAVRRRKTGSSARIGGTLPAFGRVGDSSHGRPHKPTRRRQGGLMHKDIEWKTALTRAERFATEAVFLTRSTTPHRSYAELSRRVDDAEAVLELLARADVFASLARIAVDPDEASERADAAEALAREARDEAARRAGLVEDALRVA